ncbi:type III-A CRISPR-associated protein Cas10/Csm1 [uncultured Actinobacillus sp.]|uniref:type III-A CRISPR-associated protein Cas10/Csm1 n=1 Tax=uncultured Actinobacillus sp. TaxID=417616 RepID=UPI0025F0B0BE|nr:type III-A CRISPR-associated protein Cas10/Csm1 [uncultured Actinobacillus sp.]
MSSLLFASCRIAFAALVHDLGKFAERAKLPISQDALDSHKTLYCPFNQDGSYHSHVHAAYTGYSIDQIETYLPPLIDGELYPFSSRQQSKDNSITNSLINAAAAHHKPDTFLQWVIATADRVASGFEREEFEKYNKSETKNHYQARLLTLFEQIQISESAVKIEGNSLAFRYPLAPLSAQNIFPAPRQQVETDNNDIAQKAYLKLWEQFKQGLAEIPVSHRKKWDIWLDHFDTAYQCFTGSIPSATAFGVKPEVSLYDHSKTTAALATALWRWHEENQLTGQDQAVKLADRSTSWNEQKFLLIQGDFFGIQDFIFSGGSDSNKQAAKLLRGRSFQVSLFTELVALKLLQACELPSTSQIINAAGKFLIVAPNTAKIKATVTQVQNELNQWFVENTYGLVGLGLATKEACCNDFIGDKFKALTKALFEQLEETKLQRLDLTDSTSSVQDVTYPYGVCRLNRYFPAETEYRQGDKNSGLSRISKDQITIGEQLAKKNRILICASAAEIFKTHKTASLSLPIFGYNVIFTENEAETGKFGELVNTEQLYRCWDFSIPSSLEQSVWNGYARRYINGYVAKFNLADEYTSDKYQNADLTEIEIDKIKAFDFIACEDRQFNGEKYEGSAALMTLKGDVDNLGTIFQKGLSTPTFAKMAALSRQMNQFFSLWLPTYCQQHSPNMYTVFAGGDDFFLIGPWHSTQKVAHKMQQEFARYVAENRDIHFSAGMVMSKVGLPVPRLGDLAEEALEKAKGIDAGKNAVTIFNRTVKWHDWQQLCDLENEIYRLANEYNISTSYLYSLIRLCEQANDTNHIENTIWRSRFHYRTARYVIDKLSQEKRNKALNEIAISLGDNGIAKHKINFAIPLTNYFYQKR